MPHTYFPYTQMPGRFVNLEVRTSGNAKQDQPVLAAVLNVIAKLEPDVPRVILVWRTDLPCHPRARKLQETVVRLKQVINPPPGQLVVAGNLDEEE